MKPYRWQSVCSSGKNRKGFLEFSIIMLVGLSLVFSVLLGGWIYSHTQFLGAHIRKVQEEYETEGVFWEAVSLLEEKGSGFTVKNLASSFIPSYEVTITGNTIAIYKNQVLLLEAQFRWQNGELQLTWVENPFIRPYAR